MNQAPKVTLSGVVNCRFNVLPAVCVNGLGNEHRDLKKRRHAQDKIYEQTWSTHELSRTSLACRIARKVGNAAHAGIHSYMLLMAAIAWKGWYQLTVSERSAK